MDNPLFDPTPWVMVLAALAVAGEALQLWRRRRALARANEGEADDASDEA